MSKITPIAQSSFTNSTAYDAHRPTYPAHSVQHLLEQCRVAGKQGARIVDLAAGTGKFTEALAAREEGFEILAVEPHAEMREVLAAKGLRGVRVVDGTAEELGLPVEEGWADAVFVAQGFHWFATHAVLQSLHRALQPHGTLGLIWNVESYNSPRSHTPPTEWEAALQTHTLAFDDSQQRFRHETWRRVFEEQVSKSPLNVLIAADSPLFSMPLGENREDWTVWLGKEDVWRRYRTLGQVAVLEGEALEGTRRVFDDALAGRDVEGNERGEVALHGATFAFWTTKVPGEGKGGVFAVETPGA
ncbi:hypothetical protein Q7P37_002939 [Cladosporium fusiforme]